MPLRNWNWLSALGRRDYFLQVGLNATWRVPIRKAKLNLDVFAFRAMPCVLY
jgi:hypothetical protein